MLRAATSTASGAGELQHGALRGGVGAVVLPGDERVDRAHRDDRPAVGHVAQRGPARDRTCRPRSPAGSAAHCSSVVSTSSAPSPDSPGGISMPALATSTSIAAELVRHAGRTPRPPRRCRPRPARCPAAGRPVGPLDLRAGLLDVRRRAGGDRHPRALLREPHAGGAADAGPRAGDHGHLALHPAAHRVSFPNSEYIPAFTSRTGESDAVEVAGDLLQVGPGRQGPTPPARADPARAGRSGRARSSASARGARPRRSS